MKTLAMRRRPHSGLITAGRIMAALLATLLTGCGSDQAPPAQAAVDIHKGDACAVCGMYIDAGPGPRAEVWVQGTKAPLKFGSTRDFFAYVTDPENKPRLQQLLVQDSARINWQRPSNEALTFVDARTAWYVAWQPLSGLMGPTFASFAQPEQAKAFVRAHGGEMLSFSAVTPRLTSLLDYACPTDGSPAFTLTTDCAAAPAAAAVSLAQQHARPDLLRRGHAAPHETSAAQLEHQHDVLDARQH